MQDSTGVVAKSVGEVLDVLAARFGSTAEHLWGVLIQRAVLEGWVFLGLGIFLLAIFGGATRLLWWTHFIRQKTDRYDDGFAYYTTGGIVGLLALIFGTMAAINGVLSLASPEYEALRFVLSRLP